MGNSRGNDRVSLILMDYAKRQRLKVLGHLGYRDARDCTPEELGAVALPDYKARIERIVDIEVVAFDWNCPQHITPRYTFEEFQAIADAK